MSRRSWGRVVAIVLATVMFASVFSILLTPARAGRPIIGSPDATPDYMKFIVVNNFRFDPLATTPSIPAPLRYDTVPRSQPFYYLVQFKGPITPFMKAQLAATGAAILYYIPYNAFIVRAAGLVMDRVSTLSGVRWVGVFEPAYKLSPNLSDEYGLMLQRAMDRQGYGDPLTGDAVSVIGGNSPSRNTFASSGAPTGAGSAIRMDPRSTALMSGLGPAASNSPEVTTKISLQITAFETSRVPEILRAITFLGGHEPTYSTRESGTIRVELEKSVLPKVARITGVMYIDRFVQPHVFNDLARWVTQSGDTVNFATPVHDHGIHGTGQTITIGDTGIDYKHPDFWDPNNATPGPGARKLTDYYLDCGTTGHCNLNDDGINHGTHTSGSAAGDDGVWHVYDGDATGSNGTTGPHDGQAFDAFLQVQDLSDNGFGIYFDSVTPLWQDAFDRGSFVHSDSWGSCCSTYIQEAADTDMFIWNNQDFLVVFAAGNAGSGLNSMNPFAVAKNVIAAGATANGLGLENVADFSSRGPAADGRIKPDVMAPGVALWSAMGLDPGGDGTGYFQLSGTSMATPTIAGGSTLVRSYYMEGWYPTGTKEAPNGFTPSASLIKATVINSGREMTGVGAYGNGQNFYPNDNQGFGRLTLDDALFFLGDARGLSVDDNRAGINTGGSVLYSLAIGDPSQPVEITLVWSDYPGIAGCSVCLVNDLDLVVTAPDGTIYRGNQYTGFNPGESIPNPAGRDLLNNVESVLVISGAQTGLWTVEVSGFDVPQGPQPYALVMSGSIVTNRGAVQMDHNLYQSSATVNVRVVDTGGNVDPNAPDTLDVNMTSTTETTPEVVSLIETGNATSVFAGSIPLNLGPAAPGNGFLDVANGDTIQAEYFDPDDGLGGSGPTFDFAIVDDTPPAITGIGVVNIRFNRATVEWTTDEPADSALWWGLSTPPGSLASESRRTTAHSITIKNLVENTTYFFFVQSTDEAGNLATDDNGGAYYQFTTALKPPTAPANEEWPTFHNNLPRLGISPSLHTPPIDPIWIDGPHLQAYYAGPVLSDGILFSTAHDGSIRARDPYSGALLWERTLGAQYYFTATPTVHNGVVFVPFSGPSNPSLYALDELTGATIWVDTQADTGLEFSAREQLAVADGMVFGAARSGEIFALNETDGTIVWTYQTGSLPFVGVTVAAGLVFHGTVITSSLYALDEMTGALEWRTDLDDWVGSTPVYAAGSVYVGTFAGTMYSLDAFTGTINWQTGGLGIIWFNSPAYDGAAIYFGTDNAVVYSLGAADGSILWQTSISGAVESASALANGFLYVTSWDGALRTFDTFDGSIVDTDFLSSFASASSPAISDGWVWIDDLSGNIYGFFGQLPVGLLLSPSAQRQETVPDTTVSYRVSVKNVGISGPDTFDAVSTVGAHGWTIGLYEADGTTLLSDTDGDFVPDTGSLATGASVDIVIQVMVPLAVAPGDTELSTVRFTSSNDLTRFKDEKVTTVVPPPGVTVGPRSYFPLQPGDTVAAPMVARNDGGFADTIELDATSAHGWSVTLYASDGVTLLLDSDGDGLVDTGPVGGLTSVSIVVQIQVPGDAPLDLIDQTDVVASSKADASQISTAPIRIELAPPPSPEWPQFHHDRERSGINPLPFEMPLTPRWTASPGGLEERWTAPVVSGHTVFYQEVEGNLVAADIGTGQIEWTTALGDFGWYTGTPAVAYGRVYAAFVTNGGSTITLSAVDAQTGAVAWQVDTDPGFYFRASTTIAIGAGNVYWYDFTGGKVHANDALTGANLWTHAMSSTVYQGPAYWAGMIFAADAAGNVVGLDAFTGAVIWEIVLSSYVVAAPTVVNGVVYVGDGTGSMNAIDALTGSRIWTTRGLGAIIDTSSPVVAEGLVMFGAFAFDFFSGTMYALDANTGAVVWSYFMSGGAVGTSPAYNNGTVFLSTWDGYLYAWDVASGTLLQQLLLSPAGSSSSVALADGYLVVGDQSGGIDGFSFIGAGVAASVSVSPATADVAVASGLVLTGRAQDRYGNQVGGASFSWSSLNGLGTVLPVSSLGDLAIYIAGTVAGADSVEATSGSVVGTASINVVPGSLDHVAVSPSVVSVAAGATMAFSASGEDRYGNQIPGGSFTWTVEGGIGTANAATGAFTASTTVGSGTVTAHSGTRQGSAIVQVVPGPAARVAVSPSSTSLAAGASTTFVAAVLDAYDNPVTAGTLTWSTTGGNLLQLSTDRRLYQYTAPTSTATATQTITVSQAGATNGVVTITIVAGPAVAVTISGASSVAAGATLDLDATVVDAYGNAVSGAAPLWSTTRGTIDSSGVLTAPTAVGTLIVTATAAGRQAFQAIEVTAGPLDHLVVSPTSSIRVATGSGNTVSVSAQDAYGNEVSVASFTWSTTIGSIDVAPGGKVAAFFAGDSGGTGTITVSGGGQTQTISVTVTESSLPIGRQATSATSLIFLVLAIIAIAASVFLFVRYREAQHELEKIRKGGQGGQGGQSGGSGGMG